MIPNYETGIYEKGDYSINVTVHFRYCVMGEIYVKISNLYECTPCPSGKYLLENPIIDS